MDSIRKWLWDKAMGAFSRETGRMYANAYNNWNMFQSAEPCWQVPQFKGDEPNPDRWEMK